MKRIAFLDALRVVAIFMVLLVHACEQYYFGPDGGFLIASRSDARWLTAIDSACRSAVPLFVMASAYLLFPVTRPTGEFFRRRLLRVGLPFALWCGVYVWHFGGAWRDLAFNFPMTTGGHLWFVPMLFGVYLILPLLSPWAEKATERDVRGWLILWLVTTTFPYLRRLCAHFCGAPTFGAVPYLWGECPWNGFGAFHYVSGFFGYVLLGFWFRRFASEWSARRTLAVALPLLAAGWAIAFVGFYARIPDAAGYPVAAPYAFAVDVEMSWEFCSTGVVMTTVAYFLLLRLWKNEGLFQKWIVSPLAQASYGVYLVHMILLVVFAGLLKPRLATPLAIPAIAAATFAAASAVVLIGRRIPRLGRWIFG